MRGWRKFPASAVGRVDARFVLVGEAPGIASIVNGRQWTGAGGMILRREIRRLGLDLEDLFYLTNAVKCWPAASRRGGRGRPGNRSPLPAEARRCRPALHRVGEIEEVLQIEPEAPDLATQGSCRRRRSTMPFTMLAIPGAPRPGRIARRRGRRRSRGFSASAHGRARAARLDSTN